MAYKKENWRYLDDELHYMQCSICTSQHEISTLHITSESYKKLTLEQRQDWICPFCMTKYFYSRRKTGTSRGTYTTVRPERQLSNNQEKVENPSSTQIGDNNDTGARRTQTRPEEQSSTSETRLESQATSQDVDMTKTTQAREVGQHSTSQRLESPTTSEDADMYMTDTRTTRSRPLGHRSTSQTTLDKISNQTDNMAIARTTQIKTSETETALLSELRLFREDILETNQNISSLSENMALKLDKLERRVRDKEDETLILKHALAEHQASMNDTVQPIKYFLFILVLLYLITYLRNKH